MARGEGCALWDVEGRRYLDMTAGIAVCVLGHGAPGPGRRDRRAGPPPGARLEPLLHRGAAAARRGARRAARSRAASSSATRAPRPTRRRSSWRAAIRSSTRGAARARRAGRLRGQLPRPHHAARSASPARPKYRDGLRPAGRARCASCRSATRPPRAPRITDKTLRRHRRADPGRGRHQPAAARLPAGAAAHLHRHRHRADLRRGPDRRRPHRHVLRATRARASCPTW